MYIYLLGCVFAVVLGLTLAYVVFGLRFFRLVFKHPVTLLGLPILGVFSWWGVVSCFYFWLLYNFYLPEETKKHLTLGDQ